MLLLSGSPLPCSQPNALKEIGLATGLGVVGGIWWLNIIGEERAAATSFWKNYKPDSE